MGNTGVQNFIEMLFNRTGASQTFINKENVEYTLLPQKFSRHLTSILGRIVVILTRNNLQVCLNNSSKTFSAKAANWSTTLIPHVLQEKLCLINLDWSRFILGVDNSPLITACTDNKNLTAIIGSDNWLGEGNVGSRFVNFPWPLLVVVASESAGLVKIFKLSVELHVR